MSLITGKTEYDFSKFVRKNETQCGETGKLFVRNDEKYI